MKIVSKMATEKKKQPLINQISSDVRQNVNLLVDLNFIGSNIDEIIYLLWTENHKDETESNRRSAGSKILLYFSGALSKNSQIPDSPYKDKYI